MPNNLMLQQIRKVFVAAMELKEQYDLNKPQDKIKNAANIYLTYFNQLNSALPAEVMEATSLDKATFFINADPTDSYTHVRNICHTIMFRLEDAYLKYSLEHHNKDFFSIFD